MEENTTTLRPDPGEARSRSGEERDRPVAEVAFYAHRALFDLGINMLSGFVMALLLRPTVRRDAVFGWVVALAVALGIRQLAHLAQRRSRRASAPGSGWSVLFLVTTVAVGGCWGALAGAPFDLAGTSRLGPSLLLVTLVAASSLFTLAPFRSAFPLFLAAALVPWLLKAVLAIQPSPLPEAISGALTGILGPVREALPIGMFVGFSLILGFMHLLAHHAAATIVRLQQQVLALAQSRDQEARRRSKAEADLRDAESDLEEVDAELREVDADLQKERQEHARLRTEFEAAVEHEREYLGAKLAAANTELAREKQAHERAREALLIAQQSGDTPGVLLARGESANAPAPLWSASTHDLAALGAHSVAPLTAGQASSSGLLMEIENLLDLAQISAGEFAVAREGFALRELLEAVFSARIREAFDKGVSFSWEVAEDLPDQVIGDPGRFRRVFHELAARAVDATERGWVHVAVTRESAVADTVSIRGTFTDTGASMTAAQIDQLRPPREDGEATGEQQDDHPGLRAVYGIVRALGGRLSTEARAGGGSVVHVIVPLGYGAAPVVPPVDPHAGLDQTQPGLQRGRAGA